MQPHPSPRGLRDQLKSVSITTWLQNQVDRLSGTCQHSFGIKKFPGIFHTHTSEVKNGGKLILSWRMKILAAQPITDRRRVSAGRRPAERLVLVLFP
jgi:hypothetical protein